MDQDKPLQSFTDVYEIPYTVVTLLYIAILALVSILMLFTYLCSCSEDKCKTVKKTCSNASEWLSENISGWLIRITFGLSEGVSEGENQEKKQESFKHDKQKGLRFNGHPLDPIDSNIMSVIIICFGLLAGITAYSAYFLEITHTCSEDPATYCYPQLIDPSDPANPNISQAELNYPVTDCNPWLNTTSVTFQCYRFAYNAQAALVVMGGLLAFFTVVMRVTVSIILKIFKLFECCNKCLIALQVTAVIVLLVFDIAAAIIVASFQLNSELGTLEAGNDPVAQLTAGYIANNGIQFLIIVGTATYLLLIDWKKYTWENKQGLKGLEEIEMAPELGGSLKEHEKTTEI